jgi:hypothetical protein
MSEKPLDSLQLKKGESSIVYEMIQWMITNMKPLS